MDVAYNKKTGEAFSWSIVFEGCPDMVRMTNAEYILMKHREKMARMKANAPTAACVPAKADGETKAEADAKSGDANGEVVKPEKPKYFTKGVAGPGRPKGVKNKPNVGAIKMHNCGDPYNVDALPDEGLRDFARSEFGKEYPEIEAKDEKERQEQFDFMRKDIRKMIAKRLSMKKPGRPKKNVETEEVAE